MSMLVGGSKVVGLLSPRDLDLGPAVEIEENASYVAPLLRLADLYLDLPFDDRICGYWTAIKAIHEDLH